MAQPRNPDSPLQKTTDAGDQPASSAAVGAAPATPAIDPIRLTGTAATPTLAPGETPPPADAIRTAPATPGVDANQPAAVLPAGARVTREDQALPGGLRVDVSDAERARQAADDVAPATAPRHREDDIFPASGATHFAGPGAGPWRDATLRLPEDYVAMRAASPEPIVARPRAPAQED